MAQLALMAVGTAFFGPLGGLVGGLAGGIVDQALFGKKGSKIKDLHVTTSTVGSALPELWGGIREGGQMIWASELIEKSTGTEVLGVQIKGGVIPGGSSQEGPKRYANFAISLGKGVITGIGRVWANGKEIKLHAFTYRLYLGSEDQMPDPLMVAIDGAPWISGYRGTAYIVFERMPLKDFGGSIPQLSFEVFRKPQSETENLQAAIRSVTVGPGLTEFGLGTTLVQARSNINTVAPLNNSADASNSDWSESIGQLKAQTGGVTAAALEVAWHGDDLRCGLCTLRPKVETADRETTPVAWAAAGLTRAAAQVVSQLSGAPALLGAPSDLSIYEALKDLQTRGLAAQLRPVIALDIAAGNALTNPYGGSSQPTYPPASLVTCHPAAGQPGTVDKTAAAGTQVTAFFGACTPAHFAWDATAKAVIYTGPAEWSYRRFILHMATIAKAAGATESFLIGVGLAGLTRIRSSATAYPAVTALVTLAADVSTILGGTVKVGYAAAREEWHGHVPLDGTGDVFFHLDPLWASADIDFIGIEASWPLADWRDGVHLDGLLYGSIYELAYLQSHIEGGEGHAWRYASGGDRDTQNRTTIADGLGKPWVFRNKDIRNWWLNLHYNRPAGVESGSPTAWVEQSKPVRLTQIACPAIDKGSNQPSVHGDLRSSLWSLPYYSSGRRDDAMQRAQLTALFDWWNPVNGRNPVSGVFGGRMINLDKSSAGRWDVRPSPQFPGVGLEPDARNWDTGLWLSGRLSGSSLAAMLQDICSASGIAVQTQEVWQTCDGYLAEGIVSPRDTLSALTRAFFLDAIDTESGIVFRPRGRAPVKTYARDDLVQGDGQDIYTIVRGQAGEAPKSLLLHFYESKEYREGAAPSRRLTGIDGPDLEETIAAVFPQPRALAIADALLFDAHAGRESFRFSLPPSELAIEIGDVVTLEAGGRSFRLRIQEIGFGLDRPVAAVRDNAEVYNLIDGADVAPALGVVRPAASPLVVFADLPLLPGEAETRAHAPFALAYGDPFGAAAVYRAPSEADALQLDTTLDIQSILGETRSVFAQGVTEVFDYLNTVDVEVGPDVELVSVSEAEMLAMLNTGAVQTATGAWEIFQWQNADLVAPNIYRLSKLLRGHLGTDTDMAVSLAAGARFIAFGQGMERVGLPFAIAQSPQLWAWGLTTKPVTDQSFVRATLTFKAIGLRPYAPVNLTALRDGSGNIDIGWTRRSRINNESWDFEDIPLAEESEAYDLVVFDGADEARVLRVTSPAAEYLAADEAADFGAAQSTVTLGVAQISALYGRGAMRTGTFNV